jgi:micrococcal nuclease
LKELLAGERVLLVSDPGSAEVDRYGRRLAYVYRARDGLFVNLEIVRQGFGHAYTEFPFSRMEEFRRAEREAREAGRGLWAGPSVEPAR